MSILNTSVSGMQGNSNWLSSISQNVANANTSGYKNVETDFSSLVDQISNGDADFGGVSTSQVSLNGLQGNVVSTSTTTDLAVQGSGFFVVSDASGNMYLTRNGSFTPDASGNLVNSAGYYLMAANVQNGVSPLAANSLTGLGKLLVDYGNFFKTDYVLATVIFISMFGILLTWAMKKVEQHFAHWKESERAFL